jgi:hypothetical protein
VSQQSLRQASFRAIHGGPGLNYNGDALLAMATELTAAEVEVPAGFNARMVAWLQLRLESTETNINSLMAAFAIAHGADTWAGLGSFDPL